MQSALPTQKVFCMCYLLFICPTFVILSQKAAKNLIIQMFDLTVVSCHVEGLGSEGQDKKDFVQLNLLPAA